MPQFGSGIVPAQGAIAQELNAVVRRAFMPRVYVQIWKAAPLVAALGCGDNTIRLWDLANRQEVCELRGHEAYVHAVAFSPDGTRMASASGDSTVRVWDSLSAQERTKQTQANASR